MLATRIVKPVGPSGAKICIIGEAPGEQEDRNGVPFWPYAPAGGLLERCFKQVGVERGELLIANVFCKRPPKNDVGYFYQDAKRSMLTQEGFTHVNSLRAWLERLQSEGSAPNVLVALGDVAMRVLTGVSGIYKWRGSLLPCTLVSGYKVYPTYHPSHVLRLMNEKEDVSEGDKKKFQQNVLPTFLIDLKRSVVQGDWPEIRKQDKEFKILCTMEEVERTIPLLNNEPVISCDIETIVTPKGPVLWMIGFATTSANAVVVPFRWGGKLKWPVESEARILRMVSEVLLNPRVKKLFQGGLYDLSVLGMYYGIRANNIDDTMLCHHNSHPYLPKGLGYLTSIYTWEPYHKDEGKHLVGKRRSDRGEAIYNCKDTTTTLEVWPNVSMDSREFGCWDSYRETMSMLPSLLGMMLRGVKVAQVRREKLKMEFETQMEQVQEDLNAEVGYHLNVRSSAQKIHFLYRERGYEAKRNWKTGAPTSDNDALLNLRQKWPEDKALGLIMEYQKLAILVSTFLEMPLSDRGRAHTAYDFVSTFRLNSRKSAFESGGNLQNIPGRTKEGQQVRGVFVPDDGYVLVAADYSGADAMVQAWEAEDLEDIEFFLNPEPGGIHWKRAKEVFGFPAELAYEPGEVLIDKYTGVAHTMKFYRVVTKPVVHGTNYGGGPGMSQRSLAKAEVFFPFALCRQLMNGYKARKVSLLRWQKGIREQLQQHGWMVSSAGQKRFFRGRLNDHTYRVAYAYSPQNTVGRLIQLTIRDLWDKHRYIQPLLNVHDEVVCQVPVGMEEQAMVDIKGVMERPLTIKGRELVIPASFKVGPSWGELKEV